MTFVSHAQNFEDVMLYRALKHVANGFYIDVGAQAPCNQSVTKAFYDRGWSGINIEPVPDLAAEIRRERPRDVTLQLALSSASGRRPLYRFAGSGLSTLDADIAAGHHASGYVSSRIEVETATLASVCETFRPPVVHFLKIDVEGGERDVLLGCDFSTLRPWIVIVEATLPMTQSPSFAGWEPILLDGGYRFVWFDGLNRFYVANEHAETLAPHFSSPPNIFDDFITVGHSDALSGLNAVASELNAVKADHQKMASESLDTRARDAALRGKLDAVQAERQKMAAELLDARAREAALRGELDAIKAERQNIAAELLDARARETALRAERDAIHASLSWRLTAPFRSIVGKRGPPGSKTG